MHVHVLAAEDATKAIPRLAEILIDAVAAGAGVSFLHPLSQQAAEEFWRDQIAGIQMGKNFVLVCKDSLRQIMGVVMLNKPWAPNQLHRGEVSKLLVHRDFRRQGVGSALMLRLEQLAQQMGLKLVTFDAVAGGGAEKLYLTLGYHAAGTIPGYAYSNTGDKLDDVVLFYKQF